MPNRTKRLILLGKKFNNEDTNKAAHRDRDTAVKAFLQEVNEMRKNLFDLADFCGKYETLPECSLQEALEWEREARESLIEIEELAIEDVPSESSDDEENL